MRQGNNRRQMKEERRRAFMKSATGAPQSNGQHAPSAPALPVAKVPVAPMESKPGAIRSAPPPQVQPHQVMVRSGDAMMPGVPVYAPQNNTVVPAPFTPPQEDRTLHPPSQVSSQPTASVTVILYSGGQSARFLAAQFESLRQQSVQPERILVHVDGPHGHDEKTLAKAVAVRTPVQFGRYHRLAIARSGAPTKYVAFLDEDTLPGKLWLERAISALEQAELQVDQEDLPYGAAIVVNAGAILLADDPAQLHPIGPEFPSLTDQEVDFGRGGWLMRSELVRIVQSVTWYGSGRTAFALAISAAAGAAGIPIIVQAYGHDAAAWGALRPSVFSDDPGEVVAAYHSYRSAGWEPISAASAEQAPPVPEAQSSMSQVPMPQSPTAPPPARPDVPAAAPAIPPGAKVTSSGGITQIEHVLDKPSPEPAWKATERVLSAEEATPPPAWKETERTLSEAESTPQPDYNERIVPPSEPSPSQAEAGKAP